METNLPSCFSIQFLEQLLKFLINFTLLKYVKSQRRYGFLITKELIFDLQILDLKDHFSASLMSTTCTELSYLKNIFRQASNHPKNCCSSDSFLEFSVCTDNYL